MYDSVKGRERVAMVAVAAIAAVLAFVGYPFVLSQYGGGAIAGIVYIFILSSCAFLAMRAICSRYEEVAVALLVRKGNIGIARIRSARPLGETRDVSLAARHPWDLEVDLWADGVHGKPCTIREDLVGFDDAIRGGHVFVTFEKGASGPERLAVVPTYVVYASPSLEGEVRRLEQLAHPSYVRVKRTKAGLVLQRPRPAE